MEIKNVALECNPRANLNHPWACIPILPENATKVGIPIVRIDASEVNAIQHIEELEL